MRPLAAKYVEIGRNMLREIDRNLMKLEIFVKGFNNRRVK